jgi:hypothetical protein
MFSPVISAPVPHGADLEPSCHGEDRAWSPSPVAEKSATWPGRDAAPGLLVCTVAVVEDRVAKFNNYFWPPGNEGGSAAAAGARRARDAAMQHEEEFPPISLHR